MSGAAPRPSSRRRLTPISPWPSAGTLDAHIRAEQVRIVYQQAPPAQLVSVVAVAVICWVLRDVADRGRLLAWFIVVTLMTFGRVGLALLFRARKPLAYGMAKWELAFIASLAVVSLSWGIGGWLVMPEGSPLHQAVVYFFLMGVAGGAVASYSAHGLASAIAVCALMVPATVGFFIQDDTALRAMAAGGLLYLATALRSMRSFSFFLRRTFQLSFELHQAYGRAQEQARTDELTGLANRRAFVEQGRMALEQARRYGRPLSLIMCDIDRFKVINDTWGHAAGDEVLRRVSQVLQHAARISDLVGRLGGEEFAVLLPETDEAAALALAERLRRDIAELAVDYDGARIKLTCSFGVAERGDDTFLLDVLLGAADEALYAAKAAGRDRVVRASAPTERPPS